MKRRDGGKLAGTLLAASGLVLTACERPRIRYPDTVRFECPKGAPAPVLSRKNRNVLTSYFKRTGPDTATEAARLRGNLKLTVFHRGCGRVEHAFVFELREPLPRDPKPAEWYAKAGRLLAAVARESPSADGLTAIAARLQHESRAPPAFGAPIALDDYQTLSLRLRRSDDRNWGAVVEIRYLLRL